MVALVLAGVITSIIIVNSLMIISVDAKTWLPSNFDAPISLSGDNVYIVWWTNNTSNNISEVMFRASTDGGQSFEDKINLSNTINANSDTTEIDSDGDSVVVTWWERNQTSNEPMAKISNDAGHTFGPLIHLSQNKTIKNNEG
ncbi:hypothetical protein [Candidatus Nitrosocosmicus sp. T]